MNRPYRELFDQVSASDALRREVHMMTTRERTNKRNRLTKTAVIAAVLALLLAGSAVAAQLFQIRDWFAERWQEETGTMISVDQLGFIDRLTQEIGVSDTENGVTITWIPPPGVRESSGCCCGLTGIFRYRRGQGSFPA